MGIAHEIPLCYDIVNDKAVPFKRVCTKCNRKECDEEKCGANAYQNIPQIPADRKLIDFVIGTCDDVIVDPLVGNVIVDKKTADYRGYVPKQASEHHVEQVNLYRLLLNKCKKMDAEWGCNIYIDTSEKDKVYSFAYRLRPIEDTLQRLRERREILVKWQENGQLPPRVISWGCDYCSYAQACFSRND